MAQDYDKILKENLGKTIPGILRNILGVSFSRLQTLDFELQVTLERKPDFMLKVFPEGEIEPFILHVEFQAQDDPQMANRMHEYRALARRKFGLEIRQYVIYLGSLPSKMSTAIQEPGLHFHYDILALKDIPYARFLASDSAEEVILAILADMHTEPPHQIIRTIFARLRELVPSNDRIGKYITQLEILSRLRNLQEETTQIADTMPISYDITQDVRYKQGEKAGEARGMESGMERKALALAESLLRSDLYKNGVIDQAYIAELTGCSLERIAEMEATRK